MYEFHLVTLEERVFEQLYSVANPPLQVFRITRQEEKDWLDENGIQYKVVVKYGDLTTPLTSVRVYLQIENDMDAVQYRLRWTENSQSPIFES